MAFCELHYFSEALGVQTSANVILPQGRGRGPFPVFYLLHGLSDDETMWMRRSSIERYVQDLPLIVVMPDGGRGFYCDAVEGFAYQTAIVKDLVDYIDTIFPTKADRSGRCIGGLSMGGYGAIKLELQYPEIFSSANSHSGAMGYGHTRFADNLEFQRILGSNALSGGPNDLYRLAENISKKNLPHLLIDCGKEDSLIKENRAYHTHLKKLHVPHEYAEFHGIHDWAYWDIHIQEAIAFHSKNLGIAPKKLSLPASSKKRK